MFIVRPLAVAVLAIDEHGIRPLEGERETVVLVHPEPQWPAISPLSRCRGQLGTAMSFGPRARLSCAS